MRNPDFVNQRDDFGCTPLHYAAILDNVEITHDLLTHGARLDICEGRNGYTPIEFAKKMTLYYTDKSGKKQSKRFFGNRVTCLLAIWQKEQKKKAKEEKLKKINEKKKAKK